MRRTFIILLLTTLFSLSTFGQTQKTGDINIHGRIQSADNLEKRIYGLEVRLYLNDSLIIETKPDTLGHYSLNLSRSLFNFPNIILRVTQDDKEFPSTSKFCPGFGFVLKQMYFFWDDKSITKQLIDSVGTIRVDFKLREKHYDLSFPCYRFVKNSATLLADSCGTFDSTKAILCVRDVLLDIPTLVISLQGHAWDEKDALKLSTQRAEYIKQRLVDLGVDSRRIKIKGFGDTKPRFSNADINKAKNSKDKELLKERNRRVTFRIDSYDFDPKTAK